MPSFLKYRLLSVIKLSLFVVTKTIWSRFAYMHWQSRGLLEPRGSAARQRCDSQGYAWQWREAIGKHNLLMISHGRDPVRVPWLKWFCFQIFSQTVEASFREQFFCYRIWDIIESKSRWTSNGNGMIGIIRRPLIKVLPTPRRKATGGIAQRS